MNEGPNAEDPTAVVTVAMIVAMIVAMTVVMTVVMTVAHDEKAADHEDRCRPQRAAVRNQFARAASGFCPNLCTV